MRSPSCVSCSAATFRMSPEASASIRASVRSFCRPAPASAALAYEFEIIEAVLRVNDNIKQRMVGKVIKGLCGSVEGKTIGVLGLAFKPETDDMRDSPTIPIINGLQKQGAKIRAYDPQAMDNAGRIFENVTFCRDAYETADGADALVIATEWNEFRALKLERIRGLLKQPVIIDLRNVYDPERMKSEGFTYVSVGRGEHA